MVLVNIILLAFFLFWVFAFASFLMSEARDFRKEVSELVNPYFIGAVLIGATVFFYARHQTDSYSDVSLARFLPMIIGSFLVTGTWPKVFGFLPDKYHKEIEALVLLFNKEKTMSLLFFFLGLFLVFVQVIMDRG